MKIAICDDREDDRSTLRAMLEACGQDFEIREYGFGNDMTYAEICFFYGNRCIRSQYQ